jgi:hypothetical protein
MKFMSENFLLQTRTARGCMNNTLRPSPFLITTASSPLDLAENRRFTGAKFRSTSNAGLRRS